MCYASGMKMLMKVHYDGHALVPEKPLNVPVGSTLEVEITSTPSLDPTPTLVRHPLEELARLFEQPPGVNLPTDASINHDHYLYGAHKRV